MYKLRPNYEPKASIILSGKCAHGHYGHVVVVHSFILWTLYLSLNLKIVQKILDVSFSYDLEKKQTTSDVQTTLVLKIQAYTDYMSKRCCFINPVQLHITKKRNGTS